MFVKVSTPSGAVTRGAARKQLCSKCKKKPLTCNCQANASKPIATPSTSTSNVNTDNSNMTEAQLEQLQSSLSEMLQVAVDKVQDGLRLNHEFNTEGFGLLSTKIASMEDSQSNLPSSSIKLPIFHGHANEDPAAFLEKFDFYAKFSNWDEKKVVLAFPLCLMGPSLQWFMSLANKDQIIKGKDDLYKLFHNRFLSKSDNFLLRQTLNKRKQSPTETVESYAADIRNKCRRLAINDDEALHKFIEGLKPELQSYVILNEPKNFHEAERLAKAKSAVPNAPSFTMEDVLKVQTCLLAEINSKKSLPQPPSNVAAYAPAPQQDRFDENSIKRLISEGIAEAFRKNDMGSRPRNQYFPNRQNSPNFRTNARGDFGRSDQRTALGRLTCYSCGMPGHHFRNCTRRPDPRLPRRQVSFNMPRQNPRGGFSTRPQGN